MAIFFAYNLILLLLLLKFRQSKYITFLSLVTFFILFSLCYENADYYNYTRQYYTALAFSFRDSEFIWNSLMMICNLLGLSFTSFRAIVFIIAFIAIMPSVQKISNESNIILLIYFIFPFIMDITQIRNFLAMAFLIHGLPYLSSTKWTHLVKYVLYVGIAALIHNVLIILKYIDFKKTFILSAFLLTGMIVFFKRIPSVFLTLFGSYRSDVIHAGKYVTTGIVSPAMILALSPYYLGIVGGAISSHHIIHTELAMREKKIDIELMNVLNKVFLVISATYILNIYAMDFSRISRNILLLEYAVVWESSNLCCKTSKYIIRFFLFVFSIYSLWLFVYYPHADSVFYPVFNSNLLIDLFSFQ